MVLQLLVLFLREHNENLALPYMLPRRLVGSLRLPLIPSPLCPRAPLNDNAAAEHFSRLSCTILRALTVSTLQAPLKIRRPPQHFSKFRLSIRTPYFRFIQRENRLLIIAIRVTFIIFSSSCRGPIPSSAHQTLP